jgi:hypothetical protein
MFRQDDNLDQKIEALKIEHRSRRKEAWAIRQAAGAKRSEPAEMFLSEEPWKELIKLSRRRRMTGVTDLLQQVRPEDVDDPRDHWVMDEVQINRAANLARVDKSRVLALRVHHRARTKTYDVQTGRDLPCTLDHYKSKVTVMTNGMMICEECQRGQHLQHRWSGITLLLQKKAAKKVQDLVADPTEEEDAMLLMQTDMQPQAVTQPEAAPNVEERKNEGTKEEQPEAWLSCSCLAALSLCAVRMCRSCDDRTVWRSRSRNRVKQAKPLMVNGPLMKMMMKPTMIGRPRSREMTSLRKLHALMPLYRKRPLWPYRKEPLWLRRRRREACAGREADLREARVRPRTGRFWNGHPW